MPIYFTYENSTLFKEAIIDYLSGKNDIKETKQALRFACTDDTVETDAKSFAKKIRLCNKSSDLDLDPQIVTILRHLKMDTHKRTYNDQGIIYLYDLLRKQKERDIEDLLELIDEQQPPVHWLHYIYRPTLAVIGVLGFCYMEPQYFWLALDWIIDMLPVIYHWVYHYVVQLHNLPVIGMSMQIIWLLYYLHHTFEHGLDPTEERIRTLTFRFAALSLNFLAHLLTYWALGTLSLAPAILFFTSSLVGIAESIYTYWNQKQIQTTSQNPDVHTKAWQARYHHKQDRNFNLFLIRLTYTVTITALLVAWTALPASPIFTMAYMLSMWLLTLIKDYCISIRKKHYANEEQKAVKDIYIADQHTAAQKMEEDKQTFQTETLKLINKFNDQKDKYQMLHAKLAELMQTNPFKLEESRKIFKISYDLCRQYNFTPSPQQGTHSLLSGAIREFGIYNNQTPSRLNKREPSAPTSITRMQLTFSEDNPDA